MIPHQLQQPPGSPLYGFDPPSETLAEFKAFRALIAFGGVNPPSHVGTKISVTVDPSLIHRKVYAYLFFPAAVPSTVEWEVQTKVEFLLNNSIKGAYPLSIGNMSNGGNDSFSIWTNQTGVPEAMIYNINQPITTYGETTPITLVPISITGRIDTITMTITQVANLFGIGRMMLACKSSS